MAVTGRSQSQTDTGFCLGEKTLMYHCRGLQSSRQPNLDQGQSPKGTFCRLEALVDKALFSTWSQGRTYSRVITTLSGLALQQANGSRRLTVYDENRIKCYLKAISWNCFQYINILGKWLVHFNYSFTWITIFFSAGSGFSEEGARCQWLFLQLGPYQSLYICLV